MDASHPSKLTRHRSFEIVWVNTNSTDGELMVIGGIADSCACATSTLAYTAANILSLPLCCHDRARRHDFCL
ncbi:hypothetical protein L204_101482 [Cryptococcus depauperatus]